VGDYIDHACSIFVVRNFRFDVHESIRYWTFDVRRLMFKLEWPGVEKVDVEIGDVEALAAKYPDVADELRAFQRG
jgi:hypothetical protein